MNNARRIYGRGPFCVTLMAFCLWLACLYDIVWIDCCFCLYVCDGRVLTIWAASVDSSREENQRTYKEVRVCFQSSLCMSVSVDLQDGQVLKTQTFRKSLKSKVFCLLARSHVVFTSSRPSVTTCWKWLWQNQNASSVEGGVPFVVWRSFICVVSCLYVLLWVYCLFWCLWWSSVDGRSC